jgi:hypothetical protein
MARDGVYWVHTLKICYLGGGRYRVNTVQSCPVTCGPNPAKYLQKALKNPNVC